MDAGLGRDHLAEGWQALEAARWDVVCLQEVTPTTLWPWREALATAGLENVRSSMDEWLPGNPPPEGRRLGVLVAARAPIEAIAAAHPPWPERLLSVRVEADQPYELHNLHSPISQKPDRVKLRTHRALHAHLARPLELPQVVTGDLNTPRRERPDGTVWSFARTSRGHLRSDRGEDWEAAELSVLRGLEEHGVRDVFRALHGLERREISWSYPRRQGGYRIDHILASRHFEPVACDYLHAVREAGLSDHSAMWAELRVSPPSGGAASPD
jgi:endonuclease/exonuclease/phosphatase family metal-dependent hydrolase